MADDVDCWDADVTITATFQITGKVRQLGLQNYEGLDATAPFGARKLLEVMKASGDGSVYFELRHDWGFPSRDGLVEIEVCIDSKEYGQNQARVIGYEEEIRG